MLISSSEFAGLKRKNNEKNEAKIVFYLVLKDSMEIIQLLLRD